MRTEPDRARSFASLWTTAPEPWPKRLDRNPRSRGIAPLTACPHDAIIVPSERLHTASSFGSWLRRQGQMPTELRTEPVFDALKQPLALIDNDERRRGIETYIEAARTPLERAVYDLMSQMAQADRREGEPALPGAAGVQARRAGGRGRREAGRQRRRGPVVDGRGRRREDHHPHSGGTEGSGAAGGVEGRHIGEHLVHQGARPRRAQYRRAGRPATATRRRSSDERRHGRGSRLSGWVGGDDE